MKKIKHVVQESNNGEYFYRILDLALQYADDARAAGRAEPSRGVAKEDWMRAEEMIKNSSR